MSSTLVSDDPRYREMFDVAKEAASTGGHVFGDLTPAMNALRDQAPVWKGSLQQLLKLPEVHAQYDCPREHYTLLTFALCDRAFRENLLFSSEVYRESPGVRQMGPTTILAMVGEEHRRRRSMVQPLFIRPKAINWWKPRWIQEAVDNLLDRLAGREGADLNLELCARLPVYIVTRGMGLDGDDALNFRTNLLHATTGGRSLPREEVEHAMKEVARMLMKVISARRVEPGDDVITRLVQVDLQLPEGGTRKLTDDEIFSYAKLIMNAGGGTTWRQLGITLVALLKDYRFWEACRSDRKLIESAINEGARWLPTDPTFPRLLTADVELEGVSIPQGARVDLCLGAANRDPQRWENPDVYDLFRPPQLHLGFGMGPHRCLGMEVAIQEMITAIDGLMDRFPAMRLDPNAPPPEILGGLHQRGMSAVPVLFS
jgi:cytochrome P450